MRFPRRRPKVVPTTIVDIAGTASGLNPERVVEFHNAVTDAVEALLRQPSSFTVDPLGGEDLAFEYAFYVPSDMPELDLRRHIARQRDALRTVAERFEVRLVFLRPTARPGSPKATSYQGRRSA